MHFTPVLLASVHVKRGVLGNPYSTKRGQQMMWMQRFHCILACHYLQLLLADEDQTHAFRDQCYWV